jgi:SAM-dependent methyltransferase
MKLPREWVRGPQWASSVSRANWEPVLKRAQATWLELEIASVSEGVRDSALVYLDADELARASGDCSGVGLGFSILAHEPAGFRVAIHKPGLPGEWYRAWERADNDAIGKLLGFPDCCRAFFKGQWVTAGSRDVTRAMAGIDGPWESNIMMRWLGVRLVPHLPCSGKCAATQEQAEKYKAAGARMGLDLEAIEAILRLPVEYDAAGEVAIISTPHFRFMAGTDAREAAKLYRGGQDKLPPPPSYEDNGFTSEMAMRSAHAVVARSAGIVRSALDLGCGDGALVSQIAANRFGVEVDATRADRATARGVNVFKGTIEAFARQEGIAGSADLDVVLFMPGRLTEMSEEDAASVRRVLPLIGRRLVAYAYGDWLVRPGGLHDLARSAGFEVVGSFQAGPGVQAAEVKPL